MKKVVKILFVIGIISLVPTILSVLICGIFYPAIFHQEPAPLWFSILAFTGLGLMTFGGLSIIIMSHWKELIGHIKEFINS